MGTATVIDTDKQARQLKPNKPRERIQLIETQPNPSWFERTTDPWGRSVWFIRIQITGLRVRRYGPFETKHRALLFLDQLLNEVGDALNEGANYLDRYQVKRRPFGNRNGHYPVVEDELVIPKTKNGR